MPPIIRINNQKPVVFPTRETQPLIPVAITPDKYNERLIEHIDNLYVKPLYEPMNAAQPVKIESQDDNKNFVELTPDVVQNALVQGLLSNHMDAALNTEFATVFQSSMRYTSPNRLPFEEQLITQVFNRHKLPLPSANILYKPATDIIPASKDLLMTWDDTNIEMFQAGLAGMMLVRNLKNNVLFIAVKTSAAYDTLCENIEKARIQHSSNIKNQDDLNLQSLTKVNMDASDLSTTWLLPNDPNKGPFDISSYSFDRILQFEISTFVSPNFGHEAFTIPLNGSTILTPRAVTILNIEAHAHATEKAIMKEYNELMKVMEDMQKLSTVSIKNISTAKAVTQSKARQSNGAGCKARGRARIAYRKLRGKALTNTQQIAAMHKIIKSRESKQQSHNSYKKERKTFMRPNRRNQDDINAKGIMKTTAYRPDMHIYLDTSGSISEENYKAAITNLIQLAKKTKVNLYFSSFSHILAEPVLMKTGGKSSEQLYKEFIAIPKVTGGTDFENVWVSIDQIEKATSSNGQAPRINFIISDFEYRPNKNRYFNMKNASTNSTYYVPIDINANSYDYVKSCAENLIESMNKLGHPSARNYFIM